MTEEIFMKVQTTEQARCCLNERYWASTSAEARARCIVDHWIRVVGRRREADTCCEEFNRLLADDIDDQMSIVRWESDGGR